MQFYQVVIIPAFETLKAEKHLGYVPLEVPHDILIADDLEAAHQLLQHEIAIGNYPNTAQIAYQLKARTDNEF